MKNIAPRRSVIRTAARIFALTGALLLLVTSMANADDAASGRLATQRTSRIGGFNNVQTAMLETRIMPRYVLLKHDATQTEAGYFSLVIGAAIGNDFKTTCSSPNPSLCVNPRAPEQAEDAQDKADAQIFSVSVAFDDGSQVRMTKPTANDLSVAQGSVSDRKPQPDLGGSLGVEVRLPPGAKQIVRVEVLVFTAPTDPKDVAATAAYPTAGPGWPGRTTRPWIWALNVAVAAGVAPGAIAGGIGAGAGGGATDTTKVGPADGPGSPAYEAALAAIAAMLAAVAAALGIVIGGDAVPATDPQKVPVDENGLPLPAPSKVKLAPKPEHWAQPQPEQPRPQPKPVAPAVNPPIPAATTSDGPRTMEREGTGGPRTPEQPVPIDPATTPAGIAAAEELRLAQEEFRAAQAAFDLDPKKGYQRMGNARLNLEIAESHQLSYSVDGRRGGPAFLSEDDRQARNVLQDVAKERTRIDRLPAAEREMASRGTVMAGQGDQTPGDPSLAPTGEGKWAKQMIDRIAGLDQQIAAARAKPGLNQLEINMLTTARADEATRLQIYRGSNYDTEAVNVEDSNRAFGVVVKTTMKEVDFGSGAAAQQAQGVFKGVEAPVRQSEGTQARMAEDALAQARAHVKERIDAGPGMFERVKNWFSPSSPPAKPGASEPAPEGSSGGSNSRAAGSEPAPTVREPAPTVREPAPGARSDSPTQVDVPGPSKPLPEGMVRNRYGEIVFTEPTPAQHATEIEVRNLNIDKQLGKGASPAYSGEYSKPMSEVRADDIAALKNKSPEFWNGIQDPKQKAYLEQLRDSPSPGLQIDKSMGPAFRPAGPGDGLNRQLGGLVKEPAPPVDPKAPTMDVHAPGTPGTPTQDLPHVGPGQTQVLPPGQPHGQVPPGGKLPPRGRP